MDATVIDATTDEEATANDEVEVTIAVTDTVDHERITKVDHGSETPTKNHNFYTINTSLIGYNDDRIVYMKSL